MVGVAEIRFLIRGAVLGYMVGSLGWFMCTFIYILYYVAYRFQFMSGEWLAPLANSLARRCQLTQGEITGEQMIQWINYGKYWTDVVETRVARLGFIIYKLAEISVDSERGPPIVEIPRSPVLEPLKMEVSQPRPEIEVSRVEIVKQTQPVEAEWMDELDELFRTPAGGSR